MIFEKGTSYHGFYLKEKRSLPDIDATGWLFCHEKSGAQLLYMDTNDENKVFFTAFKTPPDNHCGTAHILEHSVLCGSEKYRVKDPFNELAKGSLNTYLNALTYGDKTMYPVASCNEQDFRNLMDVYLDAVFHPLIYKKKEIFMQEGWHLSLENVDAPLQYNGVVYNEMKGALSNPERLLMNTVTKSLFASSPYRFESGGDPNFIPELSYEQFLEFHRKYYHPSNCYLYLYGNMDILSCLESINQNYLEDYLATAIPSDFAHEPYKIAPVILHDTYPVSTATQNSTYLSYNVVAGSCTDPKLSLSLQVLAYILMENNASPLKKALQDAGLGVEFGCWVDTSALDMTLSIVAKGAPEGKEEDFETIIRNTLHNLIKGGIEKDLVEAALSVYEFYLREEDYGYRPKGLAYGMDLMKAWLHGESPFVYLAREDILAAAGRGRTEPYYEQLIETYLLKNTHRSLVVLSPEVGKEVRALAAEAASLAKKKAGMTAEQLQELVEETMHLKAYQQEAEKKEDLDAIPSLKVSDIDPKAKMAEAKKITAPYPLLHTNLKSNGICYQRFVFSAKDLPDEDIPYIGLLRVLLGNMATKHYSKEALGVALDSVFGDIRIYCDAFALRRGVEEAYLPGLVIDVKYFKEKEEDAFVLLQELLMYTIFTDKDSAIQEIKDFESSLTQALQDNGHMASAAKALSFVSASRKWKETAGGISFCQFLGQVSAIPYDVLAVKLEQTMKKLVCREHFIAHVGGETCPKDAITALWEAFPKKAAEAAVSKFCPSPQKLALTTPGKVVYCSKAAYYPALGFSYSGSMKVAESLLDRAYLWNQVRVMGGAYGCGVSFAPSGQLYFYSYRDPSIQKTLNAYDRAADFLENLSLTKEDLTKYILGAINKIDKPKAFGDQADLAFRRCLSGINLEKKQEERNEILNTSVEDLQQLSPLLRKAMAEETVCVLGSAAQIQEEKELFDKIETLL